MRCNKNSQKGFTILVAVVVAGILLMIAMTIGGVALKEQMLSTANKESQVAFYAADTGMECALYWDQIKGAFTVQDDGTPSVTLDQVDCNGINGVDNTSIPEPNPNPVDNATNYSYTFEISNLPDANGGETSCSIVTVSKSPPNISTDPVVTHIMSRGYNTCKASLSRLERGVETTYPLPSV